MTDEVTEAALHAKQLEINQLRDSIIGLLEIDLLPLISTAQEALKLDPPRVHVALERLDDLEYTISCKINQEKKDA